MKHSTIRPASAPHKTGYTLARALILSVAFALAGCASALDSKPIIILMHGFPDNQHLYDLLIPHLAKQYHVVSFDFLGWGASDKPPKHLYDVASQRVDLLAVVDELKLKEVILVAHDLSGQPGIDRALDNEAKTSAFV